VENLVIHVREIFRNKNRLAFRHTGFKGAWLAQWLLELGADVHGFALEPETEPGVVPSTRTRRRLHHQIADVRNNAAVKNPFATRKPDFVFHLAAQPLVRLSYEQPVETYETNVMGTIHVMEALRELKKKVRRRSRHNRQVL